MSSNELKVGEELIDIAQRIKDSKNMVDEALQLFQSTMTEFVSDYKGTSDENNSVYTEYYIKDLSTLSEMYDKTCSYILYAFKEMHFTDEQIAGMIEKSEGSEG